MKEKLNWRVERFLYNILDEKWHVSGKFSKGVGVGTVEFCIERGFVRTKMVDRKRKGGNESYRIALRITTKGKKALE